MAKYELEYLKKAHEHSIYHEEEILKSDICGCFYYKSTFSPSEIVEWRDGVPQKARLLSVRNAELILCLVPVQAIRWMIWNFRKR